MANPVAAQDPVAYQVNEAITRERLGAHRATYFPVIRKPTPGIVITTIGAVLSVLAVTLPDAWVLLTFGLPFLVLGLIGLLVTVSRNTRQQGMQLHLFEHGLVVVGLQGRVSAFRWDAMSVLQNIVRHYRNGVHTGTTYRYTLTGMNGEPITIGSGFASPQQWGPAIQDAVTKAQLPLTFEALKAGQSFAFGDITISREGVITKGKPYAWWQVESIEVQQGYVRIRVAGKWLAASSTPVSAIQNFFVFYALAEHLRAGAAR